MADDNDGSDGGERTARPRKSARKSTRKSAAKKSPRKTAAQRRAEKQRRQRESAEAANAEHAPESDNTRPGGVYQSADGSWKNAHGTPVDPDTGDALTGDELEAAEEDRLAALDELADDED